MNKDDYKKIIEGVNDSLPFYTNHIENLKKLLDTQKSELDALLKLVPEANMDEFSELEKMAKFNSLLTISMLDLMVVCKHLCLAEEKWEKIYFIKLGYLTIYETLQTYNNDYNKFIYDLINSGKYVSFKGTLSLIIKSLKIFRKDHNYESVIGFVRNNVAGHINENFILYFETISKLDEDKVTLTISHFINILNQFLDLSSKLMSTAKAINKLQAEQTHKSIQEKILKIESLFNG